MPIGARLGGGKVPGRRLCVSRRLPWSRRLLTGSGLSDTAPIAGTAGRRGRGPEEHGRLRLDGYSGLRRVLSKVRPQSGGAFPAPHLGGNLHLGEAEVVGVGDADATALRRQDNESMGSVPAFD